MPTFWPEYGNCLAALEVPCDPYILCDGNACATSCTDDNDCVTGSFCADGVCCNTACDGACEACNLSGSVGTCTAIDDGTPCDSGNLCCAGSCETGVCCASAECLSDAAPDCLDHECVCAANSDAPCADGLACCSAGCANVQTDSQNCGACGEVCADGEICCNGSCCDGCCGADGSCGACLVFVSSSTSWGDLGGLKGADQTCQFLANNVTPVPLPGEYKAWLSAYSPEQSPAGGRFRHSGLPYQLVNGTQIAANWAELTDGILAAPISVTESGNEVGSWNVWTGTYVDGTGGGSDCYEWIRSFDDVNANAGISDLTNGDWSNAFPLRCDYEARLYCFQQR